MAKTKPFDEHLDEYEQWFIDNHFVFQSELAAIQKVLPSTGNGVEIGVGSGLFAAMLGIKDGIEPSFTMREKARKRHIHAIEGIAEKLPYQDESFDYALMVTTICFVDDVLQSFKEVHRILKKNGIFIIGFVDKNSPIGKIYLENRNQSVFYKDATFYSTDEVYRFLSETNFKIETTLQTIFGMLDMVKEVQIPRDGYGNGNFVVIKAIKV